MLALSRKLCPLFSLVFMMSCGKKMTESENSSKPHIENQEPSATLILAIETLKTYYVPSRSGQYYLPDRLRVRSENAVGKTVSITYNVRGDDNEIWDIRCHYKGAAADSMPIEKCVDQEGIDVGNIWNGSIPTMVDHGNYIRIESTTSELKVDAIYDVNWI